MSRIRTQPLPLLLLVLGVSLLGRFLVGLFVVLDGGFAPLPAALQQYNAHVTSEGERRKTRLPPFRIIIMTVFRIARILGGVERVSAARP